MSGVKIIIRNNDGDLVQLANFLDREGWEVTQNAEEGATGISTLYMDDLDQTVWDTLGYNVGGRRQIRLIDYLSNKIVHFGYTGRRFIRRTFDKYGSPVGRAWSIEIIDPNTYFQRRVLTHKGAKRPRESDFDRIMWLIGADEWDIIDQFMIGPSESTMSKADYRGQTVGDVIADCAQQARKNYWIDIVDDGAGDRLTFWYGRDTRDEYASTLSISNDLADINVAQIDAKTTTLVYPAGADTEYQMDPSRIFTGVYGTWEKGAVYRHSITGETQIERWDTAMQWPNIHEKDRAIDRAERMIERLADEDERIETTIIVAAADAHLIRAGMRIPLKLTHIPRLTSYTDCRILSRGLSPVDDGYRYRMPLVLEPIEASEPAASCSTALAAIVFDVEVVDSGDTYARSVSVTPTVGEDSFLIIGFLANNRFAPDAHAAHLGGTATEVYADQTHGTDSVGPWEHPTWAVGYDNVVAASGDYTASATFTGHNTNLNGTAFVIASVLTSATDPIQSKFDKFSSAVAGTVVFDSPATVGSMVALVITTRDGPAVTTPDLFPLAGWTQVVTGVCFGAGGSGDGIGIYVRCVAADDGDQYGLSVGSSHSHSVTAMEVAIT